MPEGISHAGLIAIGRCGDLRAPYTHPLRRRSMP